MSIKAEVNSDARLKARDAKSQKAGAHCRPRDPARMHNKDMVVWAVAE